MLISIIYGQYLSPEQGIKRGTSIVQSPFRWNISIYYFWRGEKRVKYGCLMDEEASLELYENHCSFFA
jgi:hypothetical protein